VGAPFDFEEKKKFASGTHDLDVDID